MQVRRVVGVIGVWGSLWTWAAAGGRWCAQKLEDGVCIEGSMLEGGERGGLTKVYPELHWTAR